MTNPNTDFDTPWKDVLEIYFEDFVSFFFPQAHAGIDWNQGFEFLDKELQQVVRDAELGKRLVDKLVKIYRMAGEETWVLIHIEIQGQREIDFAERMFVYYYRIYDRYRRSVASLAVLGDDNASWRPNQFERELFDCQVSFRFPVVKLLEFKQAVVSFSSQPQSFCYSRDGASPSFRNSAKPKKAQRSEISIN